MAGLRSYLHHQLVEGVDPGGGLTWMNRVLVATIIAAVATAVLATEPALDGGWHRDLLMAEAVFGSVFLVVTGGEALYADLGHFGKKPIQRAWLGLVLPALVLNYFGQGAFLLAHPEHAENPFFLMAPGALLYPLVALATAASIIASQALISGAFSLTRQATMLGLLLLSWAALDWLGYTRFVISLLWR